MRRHLKLHKSPKSGIYKKGQRYICSGVFSAAFLVCNPQTRVWYNSLELHCAERLLLDCEPEGISHCQAKRPSSFASSPLQLLQISLTSWPTAVPPCDPCVHTCCVFASLPVKREESGHWIPRGGGLKEKKNHCSHQHYFEAISTKSKTAVENMAM